MWKKRYMNRYNFRYGKYTNGSVFFFTWNEWSGVRGLQSHVRTQKHGKLPPRLYDDNDLYGTIQDDSRQRMVSKRDGREK